MTTIACLANATAVAFCFLIVLITAAASAVAAVIASPLSAAWHAATGDPAKTQTVWSAADYLDLRPGAAGG